MGVIDFNINEDVVFEGKIARLTYLVLPFYSSGTLFNAVKTYAENKGFPEDFAKSLFK